MQSPQVTRRGFLGLALLTGCSGSSKPVKPVATATPATTPAAALTVPHLTPGSPGYAAAARLYNPRFDLASQPSAIARCASSADVAACVRYAADSGTPLRLRAGGHSYGGWSSGPGLVVDVRPMSKVEVSTSTARIGAGAQLVDVYAALGRAGVALAAGSCPTVGLTGLALGGGVGVLTRAYGLTCDAVRSIEVVTADGQLREVSGDDDLFWAMRGGGGGSFGAVTALTVDVRPMPTVHRFYLEWRSSSAAEVLDAWQGWSARADRELWSTCKVLARAGTVRVLVAGTWIGSRSALQAQLDPLLTAVGAAPRLTSLHTDDYPTAMLAEAGCAPHGTAAQCATHALSPESRQAFAATSAFLTEPLPSEGIAAAVTAVTAGLDVHGLVEGGASFDSLGGAVADVGASDTAFVHRSALASIQYTATWDAAPSPAPFDAFVQSLRSALLPWTGAGAFVSYADPSLRDPGTSYWGDNLARLRSIKKQYDPDELFTFPQAVRP